MLVRVFQPVGAAVQIAIPNVKQGETEQQALARHLARLAETNPALVALPHVDLDSATLPARDKRYAWRIVGNAVVIDAAVLEPPAAVELKAAYTDLAAQYVAAMTRLDAIVTNGPTYTQVQARDAVVDIARIVRASLRFMRSRHDGGT